MKQHLSFAFERYFKDELMIELRNHRETIEYMKTLALAKSTIKY